MLKFLLCCLTFSISAGAVVALRSPVIVCTGAVESPFMPVRQIVPVSGAGVKVTFVERKDGELIFTAENLDEVPFEFGSYPTERGIHTGLPRIEVNGKEVEIGYCGTGIETFRIAPGESVKFAVSPVFPAQFAKRDDRIQIGWYFMNTETDKGTVSFSETFRLTEAELRQKLPA